ncbi:hypothetical protein PAL_GLEAN10022670 [Pteropus alecto]|uniref:Uncharacterized protein n=1 Tax=Pteropus alecto TaxID=9402 RepID=L5K541_PTEAL|nr:hypothetical protein PAL_GLEAN10022670 [Pteropus alecto]
MSWYRSFYGSLTSRSLLFAEDKKFPLLEFSPSHTQSPRNLKKLRRLGQTGKRGQRTVLGAGRWRPSSQATQYREVEGRYASPSVGGGLECPSLLDYKDRHAQRRGGQLRSETPAQRSLGSEVSGQPKSRREGRKELLIRSIARRFLAGLRASSSRSGFSRAAGAVWLA